MIQLWKCNHCGKVNYSISERHHEMNICECGMSGVDLETYGCRQMGIVTMLEELKYSPFDELLRGIKEQGIELPIILLSTPLKVFKYYDTSELKEIEDEIIKQLIGDRDEL